MGIDVGFSILVDSGVSADTKSNILQRVLSAVGDRTVAAVYNTTYAYNADSRNLVQIEVGGTSENFGIRIVMDSGIVGTTTYALILARLLQVLGDQTLTLIAPADGALYTAGSSVDNVILTLT